MNNLADKAFQYIREFSKISSVDLGLVLGSGWGSAKAFLGSLIAEIPASSIPGFSENSVPGHSNTVALFESDLGKITLVIGARSHLYEGKGVEAVAHPIRTIAASGAGTVVLTNGSGGIREGWKPGQPVLISDHLNLSGTTPVAGAQFLDLTDLYSSELRNIARGLFPGLAEGVYVQLPGPNYETPAEIQMLRAMGGDMVGMSTALEAIAAREAGMEVLGLSLITNLAAGLAPKPLSHQEVIDSGISAVPIISKMLGKIVNAL